LKRGRLPRIAQFLNFKMGRSPVKINQFQGNIEACGNSFWDFKKGRSPVKTGKFFNFKMGRSPVNIDQFQGNIEAC
jgi:formylglycine-generating enzyme required for sulfatase activity